MNKYVNITMSIAISAFLAVNLYLIFGDKSVIQKSVSVDEFERMSTDDFRVDLVKEALVAPLQTQTVYVGNENAVDSWLVTEGDVVNVGSELALLNIEQSEGRRSVLLSEQEILYQQEAEALDLISTLEYDRGVAAANSSTMTNKTDNVNSTAEDTTVEVGLNVDVNVDVSLDGSYAQAIATAERNLADIVRRMVVVEAELAQDPSRPAIVSPVDGVVSKVTLRGSTLAVDIYSSEKVIVTYVQKNEWKDVVPGLKVLVHGVGTDGVGEGTVLSVSEVPAQDDEWLQAYKFLDAKKVENPLAYYEVRILVNAETEPGTEPEIETDINPYGTNLNAIVVLEEVLDTLSIKADWVRSYDKSSAIATILDESGRLTEMKVISPFIWHDRVVVTDGLKLGDVAIDGTNLQRFEYDPRAFLTMPTQFPEKADWKSFGWRNYLMYMGLK
ncbi:efflux RND transporter periplasmic adaptor subunit [Sporosarcina siberiensis]|uniref:Efflux RND transporter periplasmic adaptor subunit n=1 Tax=Sporosarcina siberiensis TaxID=1365606 RepID=A0ABW4SK06_9BACL